MAFAPLAGVRVVDVTTSYAGPTCTQLLGVARRRRGQGRAAVRRRGARLGAALRRRARHALRRGELRASARSRSTSGAGTDVVLRLVDGADVFVQSLRPGLADELGLGADALRARKPELVHCTISSYGRTGPKATLPGYDPLLQAAAGLISVTGEPGRAGRPDRRLADRPRDRDVRGVRDPRRACTQGGGATLDVSLWETALSFVSYHLIGTLETGAVPTGQGTAFHAIAPYQVFPTEEGGLMITAANDGIFRRLVEALGAPELADDPRFATNPDRVANREALAEALTALAAQRHPRRLAREARRRQRPGGAGAGHGRGRRRPAARGDRHPPARRRRDDARPGVLGRRRAARVLLAAARARRAHRGGARARPATPRTRSPSSQADGVVLVG